MTSTTSKPLSSVMELEDRDPNTISHHLQVGWNDVIGEPQKIRSPECAWSVSRQCFRISKKSCYICLSVLCAPIIAFCLGITFAALSFKHIWCINPCLTICKLNCAATRKFMKMWVHGCLIPCAEGIGHIFSTGFTIRNQQLSESPDRKEDDILTV